jgi:hypothetical protein
MHYNHSYSPHWLNIPSVRKGATVDPETRSLENGICLTQQIGHMMILYHNGSTISNESNQNVLLFVTF